MFNQRNISVMLIVCILCGNIFLSTSCWWDQDGDNPAAPGDNGGMGAPPMGAMATPTAAIPTPAPATPTPTVDYTKKTNDELIDYIVKKENEAIMGLFEFNEFVQPNLMAVDLNINEAIKKLDILSSRFGGSMLKIMMRINSMGMIIMITKKVDEFIDSDIHAYDVFASVDTMLAASATDVPKKNRFVNSAKGKLNKANEHKAKLKRFLTRHMINGAMDNGGL